MLVEAIQSNPDLRKLPPYALEKIVPYSDDVVLCMDAKSGKTLWKAVIEGRGRNVQHHKNGPKDMAPAYSDGRIFALGMSGWLYAFDAETGDPLWEVEADYDISNQLLVIGDVLVGPTRRVYGEGANPFGATGFGGYDVETGRMLWRAGEQRSVCSLTPWTKDGRHYLIGRLGLPADWHLGCLDAKTGEEVWRLDMTVTRRRGQEGEAAMLGGVNIYRDIMLTQECSETRTIGHGEWCGYGRDLSLRLSTGPGRPDARYGERVRVCLSSRMLGYRDSFPPLFMVSLPCSMISRSGFADRQRHCRRRRARAQNGGYLQVMEDLVMCRIDGTHGRIQCDFYKVNEDGTSVPLNPDAHWSPPIGGSTTSYHHPLFYPMVDGRVLLRQENGVGCWDFRYRQ